MLELDGPASAPGLVVVISVDPDPDSALEDAPEPAATLAALDVLAIGFSDTADAALTPLVSTVGSAVVSAGEFAACSPMKPHSNDSAKPAPQLFVTHLIPCNFRPANKFS